MRYFLLITLLCNSVYAQIPNPPSITQPVITGKIITTDPLNVKNGNETTLTGNITIANGITLNNTHDVTIRGVLDPNGKQLTNISFKGTDKTHVWTLNSTCTKIKFQDLNFTSDHDLQSFLGLRGTQITVINCTTTGNATLPPVQLVQTLGIDGAWIKDCNAGIVGNYWFTTSPSYTNNNIIIENCKVGGSLHQHPIRCWNLHNAWFINDNITNNNGGPGQCYNIRSGEHIYLKHCIGTGSEVTGPLEISGQEHDLVKDLWITDSTFTVGNWQLPSGLIGGHFVNCQFDFKGEIFSFRKSVYGKPMATISIENCNFKCKRFCTNQSSIGMTNLVTAKTSTINGNPLIITDVIGW